MARWGNGANGLLLEGFALSPPFSLGCWFRPELDQISTLMAACTSSAVTGFYALRFRGDQAGDPLEAIQQETSPGAVATASQPGTVLGSWQYGLGVFASNSNRAVYLNGTGTTNGTPIGTATPNRLSMLYSARGASPSAYLGGGIAHAAVWSARLLAGEAAALASGCPPWHIRPGALVAYWPLDGLNRAEETDEVGARRMDAGGTSWGPGPNDQPGRLWIPPALIVTPGPEPEPEPGTGAGGALRRRRIAAMIARARAGR